MTTNLEKLRQKITPVTEAQARASMASCETTPAETPFVFALETEMRDDFLAIAHQVTREVAAENLEDAEEDGQHFSMK